MIVPSSLVIEQAMRQSILIMLALTLLGSGCSGGGDDDYYIQKVIRYKIVDPHTGDNLVDTHATAVYHPDSIVFYENGVDLGLRFVRCYEMPNGQFVSGDLEVWKSGGLRPLQMPIRTVYVRLNSFDTDTLQLFYQYDADHNHYDIVSVYNGYQVVGYYLFGPSGCATELPKFSR